MDLEQFFDALALMENTRKASFDDVAVEPWSEGFRFEGHAAVFDQVADIGAFTEEIQRGAFRKVLSSGENVPMLVDHLQSKFLASTASGNLRLEEREKGLHVEADIPPTDEAKNLRVLVEAKEIRGMSYGFVCGQGNSQVQERNGRPHRRITNFQRLLDVSPTWNPAFSGTDAQFRSLAVKYADSPESLQQLLSGAYPQLGERAATPEIHDVEPDEAAEELRAAAGSDESGAAEIHARLAARKRRLAVMSITLGGYDDAS